MAECAEIRRSVEVDVPAEQANKEWTQFIFYSFFMRRGGPDASEADPDEGFVRVEEIGGGRTRVTVDLNYCPQYEDVDDRREIAEAQEHLDYMLGRYKEFVERRAA
jgi:uncharacterized membrane protein